MNCSFDIKKAITLYCIYIFLVVMCGYEENEVPTYYGVIYGVPTMIPTFRLFN